HRALQSLTPAPQVTVDLQSQVERKGGVPVLSLAVAVVRIAIRAYRVASSRLVIVDDYFFPIYPVKKRQGVTIVQVWHACGAFKRFGRATLEAEWGADEIFLKWVPIHANYDLTLVSSASIAPIYAAAFGQPVETSRRSMPPHSDSRLKRSAPPSASHAPMRSPLHRVVMQRSVRCGVDSA
ncbi:MAG: hypothetical protein RI971_132, partial [Chloroflexota bacterium]